MRDDFANSGGFAGAGGAGDVDAGAAAVGDGRFEVRVYETELGFAAGEGGRDRGDVQLGASELVGRVLDVHGGENAGGQWREFEVLLDHDLAVGGGCYGVASSKGGFGAFASAGWGGGVAANFQLPGRARDFGGGFGVGIVVVGAVFSFGGFSFGLAFSPGGFGALLDEVEKSIEVLLALVDVFPFELVGVSTRSRVATSAAGEDFPELFGFSWDFSGWVLFHKGLLGQDSGLAVDSGEGVEVETRCYIKLVLHFKVSNLTQGPFE